MRVPKQGTGTEQPVVAEKSSKDDGAKGLRHPARTEGQPREREEPEVRAKPFRISKRAVWEAYKRVRARQGAAGVDAESIEDFEQHLQDNLYKLWNRVSSGTYFPPPVRSVEIPKKGGGFRKLGIPTVSDRIAQGVVKAYLEPLVEPQFHLRSIEKRLGQCKLELHPEKTKIVYCKDDDRRGRYEVEKFDFLGYTFRPRRSKNRWGRGDAHPSTWAQDESSGPPSWERWRGDSEPYRALVDPFVDTSVGYIQQRAETHADTANSCRIQPRGPPSNSWTCRLQAGR